MTAIEVSVVVPVYNPGSNIDDCIRTLLHQSLDPAAYEVIFVDDGSTDATPARLDALAAEHPNVHVKHIPNSGWPGRPRNLGVDLAQGEYVYFVDNDDWIGEQALERLLAMARADAADIVIGKVVGHGKSVPRAMFRANRSGVDLSWDPLLWLLTPHKLWRRSFLVEHDLRFAEGPRRLEDHLMSMRAYFCSPRISILADYPCYHWVLRDREVNASWNLAEWSVYFGFQEEVLDVIDANTEPGPFRDRLYARWYRGKMLNRLPAFYWNDPERRMPFLAAVQAAAARFPESVDDHLPVNLRARSTLLRAGRFDELIEAAAIERAIRARARARAAVARGGELELTIDAELDGLRFRRAGDRIIWQDTTDVTEAIERSTVQLLLKRRATQEEYRVATTVTHRVVDGDDGVRVVARATGSVVAATGAGGGPLAPAEWEVHIVVIIASFRAIGRVLRAHGSEHLIVAVTGDGRVIERRPGWKRNLRRRTPRRVVAAIRELQRRRRRARERS